MTCGVYAIVNLATGKAYIGSSTRIEIRWRQWGVHLRRGTSANQALQVDWAASRGEGFAWRILETVNDVALLAATEQRWLNRYKGRCYNVSLRVFRPPSSMPPPMPVVEQREPRAPSPVSQAGAAALARQRWEQRTIEKICLQCGQAFLGDSQQAYCSKRHQLAAAARRYRSKRVRSP